MESILAFLKAAADESRLRILRLLLAEKELNVGELTAILGLAQSTVSRQIGELRKAGLIVERREGGFTFCELVRQPSESTLERLLRELADTADPQGDLARLGEVRRERADRGDLRRQGLEPGRSWVAWARALRFLLPRIRVADFGCGDGALTAEIATWAERVVAIERLPAALERARARLDRLGAANVELMHEDLEDLTLASASVDLVVVSHALHFVSDPSRILSQARRVLVPGGRVLVLELAAHGEEWVREQLGHVHLGFPTETLEKSLAGAGFTAIEVERTPRDAAREPFRILIASALAPSEVGA